MSDRHNAISSQNPRTLYQIRIKGSIDSQWREWFEGFSITLDEDGNTLLTGQVVDQAALYGLLKKVRDLGMTLVSVVQIQSDDMQETERK
jgi:hypothetical protein